MTRRPVPERTCFRCDGVFASRSTDRRVYCPICRINFGFSIPSIPLLASRAVAAGTPGGAPAGVPVRVRCGVCGRTVPSGQTTCDAEACAAQPALFSTTPDRRRKEWRHA